METDSTEKHWLIPVLCCSFHWRSDKNSSEIVCTGGKQKKKIFFLCPQCFKTEFVSLILRREKLILFQILLHEASILYPKFYQNQWCNLHYQWCLIYALGCDHIRLWKRGVFADPILATEKECWTLYINSVARCHHSSKQILHGLQCKSLPRILSTTF